MPDRESVRRHRGQIMRTAAALVLLLGVNGFARSDAATAGPWRRAAVAGQSLCGQAEMDGAGVASSATIRRSTPNCGGGATGSELIETLVAVQYLGWDLEWHTCGFNHESTNAFSVVAAITTQNQGCIQPDDGWTFRALSVHGGAIDLHHFAPNHWPLVTSGVIQ